MKRNLISLMASHCINEYNEGKEEDATQKKKVFYCLLIMVCSLKTKV